MKVILKISLLILLYSNTYGQNIQLLMKGIGTDSSFYCAEKISNNEFWIGGEYGILKKIDSLGNIYSLNLPNDGIDILKIKKQKKFIYITTANSIIYRYDIETQTFLKKVFAKFKNKCFYDIAELEDGSLLVCGGAKGIANGEKKIPRGFIASINNDFEEIEVIWKSYRKFVWSLLQVENNKILAYTFNGINTRVIESRDLQKWKRAYKIKGLVHKTTLIDNELWYSGTKNINFKKDGIIGEKIKAQKILRKMGCLWSIEFIGEKIIAVTNSGEIIQLDKGTKKYKKFDLTTFSPLYDVIKITPSKLLIVGHGKTAFFLELPTGTLSSSEKI